MRKIILLFLVLVLVDIASAGMISDDIYRNIECNVTKTGAEVSLDVNCTQINNTAARIDIGYINKTKLIIDYQNGGKLVNQVPISTIKGTLSLPTKLDLNSGKSFIVDYGTQPSFSFKIGYESVTVAGGHSTTQSLTGVARNIYIDNNGTRNVAYIDSGNDISFADSTTGNSWQSQEVTAGTHTFAGITGNTTNGLLIYYLSGGNVLGKYTENRATWSSEVTLMDATEDLTEPTCVANYNGTYLCTAFGDTLARVYTSNATAWNTEVILLDSTTTVIHDVMFGYDNCPYVVMGVFATTPDTISIYDGCRGWATTTVKQSNLNTNTPEIHLSINSDNVFLISTREPDLNYPYICVNNTGAFVCTNITSSTGVSLQAAINSFDKIAYITASAYLGTGTLEYGNSSATTIPTWQKQSLGVGGFPSMADQTIPATAKLFDKSHIVYSNATAIWYVNYSVAIVDEPPAITLIAPPNNQTSTAIGYVNITFNCSAVDDLTIVTNISLYITDHFNQSLKLNATRTYTTNNVYGNFTLELENGEYTWTCEASDDSGHSQFADYRSLHIVDPPATLYGFAFQRVDLFNYSNYEFYANLTVSIVNPTSTTADYIKVTPDVSFGLYTVTTVNANNTNSISYLKKYDRLTYDTYVNITYATITGNISVLSNSDRLFIPIDPPSAQLQKHGQVDCSLNKTIDSDLNLPFNLTFSGEGIYTINSVMAVMGLYKPRGCIVDVRGMLDIQ